jgi:UDP-N-acetylmuramoylalanine--D-glutamate ligase
MCFHKNIEKSKFFIAGAAKSGLSVAKLLKNYGANVFITEEKKLSQELIEELNYLKIPFEDKGHSLEKITNECDVMVLSPGIPLNTQIPMLCMKKSLILVSEIEVASWFLKPNNLILAITGTNGKSTTVNYLNQLINLSEYNSIACGNIGTPFSHVVSQNNKEEIFVLELSSYQLELTFSIQPKCSAILNIQNDHLGRYETIEEYLKAKWRIVLLTDPEGLVILDYDVLKIALKIGLILPKCKIIVTKISHQLQKNKKTNNFQEKYRSFQNKLSNYKYLPNPIYKEIEILEIEELPISKFLNFAYVTYNEDDTITVSLQSDDLIKKIEINKACIPGMHNVMNILTASLIAQHLGIHDDLITSQWNESTSQYVHLPHRLEKIGKDYCTFINELSQEKNLLIINDSKATNVESTLVALNSFKRPIRLLLGGKPKGDSYKPILEFFNRNLIKVYPFGEASEIIFNELKSKKNYLAKPSSNMISAATLALNEAHNNEIILLSPACSSFDEFRDFEHRGNVFREWALSHLKENKSESF